MTHEIRRFIEAADGRVEDLSYDISRLIRLHHTYKPGFNTPDVHEELILELLHCGIVKNEEDASVIAEIALYQLYPELTRHVKGLGYTQAIVHDVRLNVVPQTRSVNCKLIIAVI